MKLETAVPKTKWQNTLVALYLRNCTNWLYPGDLLSATRVLKHSKNLVKISRICMAPGSTTCHTIPFWLICSSECTKSSVRWVAKNFARWSQLGHSLQFSLLCMDSLSLEWSDTNRRSGSKGMPRWVTYGKLSWGMVLSRMFNRTMTDCWWLAWYWRSWIWCIWNVYVVYIINNKKLVKYIY